METNFEQLRENTNEKEQQLEDLVLESYEAKQIETLLHEMDDLVFKLKTFKESLEHHAEDKEDEQMFPQAHERLDELAFEQFGQQLEAAKRKRTRVV
jgi:hypothetical protein